MSTPPRFVAFEAGEKAAAVATFIFASLSTVVLSFVLLCVLSVVFFSIFKRTSYQNLSREAFFFRTQLGQYAACLLLSNWIRGVSEWISIGWISSGGVRAGSSSCSAQGSLKQIGQFGSFFFIVTMGVHTFNSLVLRNRQPQWLGPTVTFIGWASAIVIGLAPLSISSRDNDTIYNIDRFNCGISRSYDVAHMLLYFLPLFLASFISAIVYSLIFLIIRGTLVINGGLRIRLDPGRRLRVHETFEEYQRFIYSVAQTMLWLPISFILALLPSSIVQLMDISGIAVSPGVMAFSYILESLDGIINVVIIFNVLRALGPAIKSAFPTDPEKGRLEQSTVSRPKHEWNPQARFSAFMRGSMTKTAPPARPPGSIHQWSVSRPSSLARSPFLAHKKTGSANSTARLLTPEVPSRSHSPSLSLERPEDSSSGLLAQEPIAPASLVDAELSLPPQAVQKHPQMASLRLSTSGLQPQLSSDPTGLTPSPRGKRSRVSRDQNLASGSPTKPVVSSNAPFLEVTLHSPRSSITGDGVGSLISMYLSRNSTASVELPPFPAPVVQRDSSVGIPVTVPHEGLGFPLKAAVSIGAVGGRQRLVLPPVAPPEPAPAPLVSPADSTDTSQYSGTEAGSPPPPPLPSQVRPTLQPTQPLRLGRSASMNVLSRASQDRQPSGQSHVPRRLYDRPVVRALPNPPNETAPLRLSNVRSHTTSRGPASSHSHKGSSASSYGYL